jgi:ATPase subunit of ABC transporter with duplicated ATPase domains
MPPRSQTYEKRSKPSRPDREDKEQQRQERENAQRIAKQTRARLAKSLADSQKKALASAKAKKAKATSPKRNPADNQKQIQTVPSKIKTRASQINNAVKTTTKSKMSPPISKPKSPTKFTISGGLIKGGTIYKDEITGSTLAGRDTRMKALSDPKSVKVVGSRSGNTLLQARPDMSQTTLNNTLQKITGNNQDVVDNLTNPSKTKTDLLTGQPIEKVPTLLSDIRKKKNKRNLGGGNFMSSLIRTLLG